MLGLHFPATQPVCRQLIGLQFFGNNFKIHSNCQAESSTVWVYRVDWLIELIKLIRLISFLCVNLMIFMAKNLFRSLWSLAFQSFTRNLTTLQLFSLSPFLVPACPGCFNWLIKKPDNFITKRSGLLYPYSFRAFGLKALSYKLSAMSYEL